MEEFRKIEGYENYSISNLGNVRKDANNKILKSFNDINGFRRVLLGSKKKRVDLLVADTFIPNEDKTIFTILHHKDSNVENNHASNLQWISKEQNRFYKNIQSNNTSGFKGITWNKQSNKWRATIGLDNKMIHVGSYTNIEDARIARQKKVNELFVESTQRVVNLNIKLPPNTKLNINFTIDDDDTEEYKSLEQEFEQLIK
jgi:hypothetical protein